MSRGGGRPGDLYRSTALAYRKAGWPGVLPLPRGEKKPPPEGFTGKEGTMPSAVEVLGWMGTRPTDNIGLRLGDGTVALDVDDYDGKMGAQDLADLELRWGALPPTVSSSSRDDGVSSIRFYRTAQGIAWAGDPSTDIQLIRHDHRYAVVWPSIHPEGRVYTWRGPDGEVLGQVPSIDDLAELPEAWVTGLSAARSVPTSSQPDEVGQGSPWLDVPAELARGRHTGVVALAGALVERGGMRVDEAVAYMQMVVFPVIDQEQAGHPYSISELEEDVRDVFTRYGQLDAAHRERVAQRVKELRATEEAKQILQAEKSDLIPMPVPTPLSDFLNVDDATVKYRLDQLWPVGGRVILAAAYKSGKTTMVGNLIKSLVDGDPFLGEFEVERPEGKIGLYDDELDERMLRRWLRDHGIRNADQVIVISMRGRTGSFDLTEPSARTRWANLLREQGVGVVILDCLRPVLDGLGLSENDDVGKFLEGFDALLVEAEVGEGLIVHHTGHAGERSRGSSRLRDWPDAEWTLTRETEQPDSPRYFKAYGRDVDFSEHQLGYDEDTRALQLTGIGSRRSAEISPLIPHVVDWVREHPDQSSRKLEIDLVKALTVSRSVVRDALAGAIAEGRITWTPGPRRSKLHRVTE